MRQFKGAIYNSYRELEDLSRQARYDCVQWDQDDVAYALGLLQRLEDAIDKFP